jgi:hypothetical protein
MRQFRDRFLNSPAWKTAVIDSWTIDPRWRGRDTSELSTTMQMISIER